MAAAYKILYQASPNTSYDGAAVGVGKSQVISSIVVANVTTSDATARIHARIAGAATAISNALVYNVTIPANTSVAFTLGITLAATDQLTFVSGTGSALTFTAFGSEIS